MGSHLQWRDCTFQLCLGNHLAGSGKMPPTAVQTDWSRNQEQSCGGLLTDSSEYFKWAEYTSRSLEDPILLIYSTPSYMPFTWTISKLWCKSEWLQGQYEKTVINKSHFGLYMLIYQPNQHFPLFITCWIPSQWKCKDLNLFMLLSFLPVCEKSLWNLSLGSPSSRSTSCFDSITVLVLKARSSQGSHSHVLNCRGTGQLPLLLIHLLWPAYEYLTVFKRSN